MEAKTTKQISIHVYAINPFPKDKILDSSKLKEFADDNFKFGENDKVLKTRRKH